VSKTSLEFLNVEIGSLIFIKLKKHS